MTDNIIELKAPDAKEQAKNPLIEHLIDTLRQNGQQNHPQEAVMFQPRAGENQSTFLGIPGIEVPKTCATISEAAKPKSLEQLAATSQDNLACLYHSLPAGHIPNGDTQGRAIFMAGSGLGDNLSGIANHIWKGKVFDQNGGLLNKILGQHLISAEVSQGTSWLDGKPSTIIEYKNTSLVAGWIRDEVREVQPGLYLGVAYARLPNQNHFPALFFALDANHKK